MMGVASAVRQPSSSTRPSGWSGIVIPPLAWFVSLIACYFMVTWACGGLAGRAVMHAVCLSAVVIAGAVGFASLRRQAGLRRGSLSGGPSERQRFLATLATLTGTLFTLIILAQWLAAIILDPCVPAPRLPQSPQAGIESRTEAVSLVR